MFELALSSLGVCVSTDLTEVAGRGLLSLAFILATFTAKYSHLTTQMRPPLEASKGPPLHPFFAPSLLVLEVQLAVSSTFKRGRSKMGPIRLPHRGDSGLLRGEAGGSRVSVSLCAQLMQPSQLPVFSILDLC